MTEWSSQISAGATFQRKSTWKKGSETSEKRETRLERMRDRQATKILRLKITVDKVNQHARKVSRWNNITAELHQPTQMVGRELRLQCTRCREQQPMLPQLPLFQQSQDVMQTWNIGHANMLYLSRKISCLSFTQSLNGCLRFDLESCNLMHILLLPTHVTFHRSLRLAPWCFASTLVVNILRSTHTCNVLRIRKWSPLFMTNYQVVWRLRGWTINFSRECCSIATTFLDTIVQELDNIRPLLCFLLWTWWKGWNRPRVQLGDGWYNWSVRRKGTKWTKRLTVWMIPIRWIVWAEIRMQMVCVGR